MARKTFLCNLGILTAAALFPLIPQALAAPRQDQSTASVADAARKARAEKKATPAGGKVYTNDDVENMKGTISVVGPGPAAPAATDKDKDKDKDGKDAAGNTTSTSTSSGTPGTADAAAAPKDEASWRKTFAEARKKLADDSKELDILQREFNLKQTQFYTDPNAALQEQFSRKDLNDTQAQIDAKKQVVDQDTKAISDLEDQLRTSGGDAGWARE